MRGGEKERTDKRERERERERGGGERNTLPYRQISIYTLVNDSEYTFHVTRFISSHVPQ